MKLTSSRYIFILKIDDEKLDYVSLSKILKKKKWKYFTFFSAGCHICQPSHTSQHIHFVLMYNLNVHVFEWSSNILLKVFCFGPSNKYLLRHCMTFGILQYDHVYMTTTFYNFSIGLKKYCSWISDVNFNMQILSFAWILFFFFNNTSSWNKAYIQSFQKVNRKLFYNYWLVSDQRICMYLSYKWKTCLHISEYWFYYIVMNIQMLWNYFHISEIGQLDELAICWYLWNKSMTYVFFNVIVGNNHLTFSREGLWFPPRAQKYFLDETNIRLFIFWTWKNLILFLLILPSYIIDIGRVKLIFLYDLMIFFREKVAPPPNLNGRSLI